MTDSDPARPTIGGDYGSARQSLTEAACICDPHSPLIKSGCTASSHSMADALAASEPRTTYRHGDPVDISTTGSRAQRICEAAADLVNNDRNAVYGDAEVNFNETGALWAVIFGHEVTAEQVAVCMALVKIARLIKTPNHADSWTDGVGYLALGGGIASKPGRYL